jgi:uncharacterized protein (DUF3084 family)
MTLAILLCGLVVATCFIAYIADNIGKNMGKKRVSLFGLRPRQTATLISMASSVFIMLATVGILMATSQSVSNALLRYDAARKEANERQRENEKLLRQNTDLRTNLDEQRAQIKKQNDQIERNSRRVAFISRQSETAVKQLETAKARLKSARANAASAQKQLASARRQFQSFKTQLNAARTQVAAAKSRVANAQTQVANARQQLQQQQKQVSSTNKKLKDAQELLDVRKNDLAAAKNDLLAAQQKQDEAAQKLQQAQQAVLKIQGAINKSLVQIATSEATIADLEVRRNKLQTALEAQARQLEQSKSEVNYFADIAQKIATGDIAIPQGEVFAERTVAANLSTAQVRADLHALMKAGREYLSEPPRTLQLALPREAQNLSEDEFLNGFAAYLSTLDVPVSVRLLAARDHASGETEIFARLLPVVVRTIFKKGEVLGTATIEADAGDARIFNQLLKLLNETEQRARERGVTPLPTRENPLFYPTGTNERVFEALRQIQSEGGSVEVRLIAAEDISTVDSPHVRFEITRQASS